MLNDTLKRLRFEKR